MSMQLDLFAGPHLPIFQCRAALERGDLQAARAALLAAPADGRAAGARIATLEERLRDAGSPEAVHRAFEMALTLEGDLGREPIGPEEWFRLYSTRMAAALAATPNREFRGWCALHFHLAAGQADAALRAALESRPRADGRAWLEAARAAFAAGEDALGRRWTFVGCLLATHEALDPDPPPLTPVASNAALNPAGPLLPRLPPDLEDLWTEAVCLDLPSPPAAWVPCIGALDGVFTMALSGSSEVREVTGFDPSAVAPPGETAPRAFLRALVSARRAHEREIGPGARTCGEAELRHRARMRDTSPTLLSRYLERLGVA